VSLARRKPKLWTRPVRQGVASFRSLLAAFIIAFSLILQLFAVAAPPGLAAPAFAGADDAAIAAELKAIFGDTAQLCVQINDKVPGKHAPSGHSCDMCPLCRSLSQTAAYDSPDAPALPEPVNGDSHAIRAPPGEDVLASYPAQPNPARAPPLDV
jgi:hypothetical protein